MDQITDRILRMDALVEKTGISRAQVARLESEGKFPARIVLAPRCVGWLQSEVDKWIAQRVADSRRADPVRALPPSPRKAARPATAAAGAKQ